MYLLTYSILFKAIILYKITVYSLLLKPSNQLQPAVRYSSANSMCLYLFVCVL